MSDGAELHRAGPVVIVQADTDPGDMGEPREFVEGGATVLIVPSFDLWRAAGALEERDKLRMVIRNAIDNIAHNRYGHAIRQLRAARSLFEEEGR